MKGQSNMKKMMGKILCPAAGLLLALPLSAWARQMGSQMGQQQQTQQQQGQTGQGQTGQGQTPPGQNTAPAQPAAQPAAPPVDPAEEAAYKDFSTLKGDDPGAMIKQGEAFITKYPNSHYLGTVYAQLTVAYMNAGDENKMNAAGDKALEITPNNVDVLPVMAMATSRRLNPGDADYPAKLRKTQTFANQGIQSLNSLQKPAAMTDEQFAHARDEKLAMCHSALGLADLDQNKPVEATQEFTEALKLEATPDPVDQYLLGMTLMQQNQFAQAQTAFESCAKPGSAMSDRCKQQADTAKKQAAAKPH
jgi:hypothetical protein